MKLTISRKLLSGYLMMALVMMLVSAYAVSRLQHLNQLANTIINQDFTVLETAKQMTDTLLALENAEKKYLILKDPSIADIFWARNQELNGQLAVLGHNTSREIAASAFRMIPLKKDYEKLFQQEVALIGENRDDEALKLSADEGKKLMDSLIASARALQKQSETSIDKGMKEINIRSVDASRIMIFLTAFSLIVGFVVAVVITWNISRPLKRLEKATGLVSEGKFDIKLSMERNDEIGLLARSFDMMTRRLKILDALQLDASPLTRLPGNLAIEQEIERRLFQGKPFSLCHVDLDNFKPFADAYGYAWGSEVIKETALLLEDIKKAEGENGYFVGHIGGDDFVLIGDPEGARKICRQVVDQFAGRILKFYNEEDRQRGFLVGKDRQGHQRSFPLITITISVVTDDGKCYKNPLDMAKMAAEVKEYGKTLPGNNCITKEEMDQRAVQS